MIKKLTTLLLSAALTASFLLTPMCRAAASSKSVSSYTGLTYTHADTFDGKNIYNGIDVSYHQPTIDWNKVKAAGIDFVFVRVGYRGYGAAGTLAADTCFEKHVSGALAAGLKVGLYYYTEAINTTEAIEEANYCIEKAKDYDITLPIVYDYETTVVGGVKTGRKYNANLSKTAATKNCTAFCNTIQKAGYTPMVYANKSDLSTLINGASLAKSYKIWLANYTTKTTYSGTYEFWQYSESGKVNGISGTTDCNYWYTDTNINENPNGIDIKTAQFASVAKKAYTGSSITPSPKLTLNGKKLTKNTDYQLTYKANTSIGTATITATGIGNYKGTISTTFSIVPQKVASFQKKSSKKEVTLSWEKNNSATGYILYRKADYNSTTYTKVKVYRQNTNISWSDTSLKSEREYFYRIRAYTKVDGKNYYSSYTTLDNVALSCSKKGVLTAKASLYQTPELSGTALAVIPASAQITYLGRTYTTGSKFVYHIKYKGSTKTYNGYVASATKITF